MRFLARGLGLLATLGLFFARAVAVRLVPGGADARRRRVTATVAWMCRRLVRAFGIDLAVEGALPPKRAGRGRLIIANHISYLDVALIGAAFPATFVTSVEVGCTPGLGLISRLGGCLFVERRRRTSVLGDIEAISALLNRGHDVMFFPEGTTSDGSRFLEFKQSLLESAVRSRSQVTALCLKYEAVDGEAFGRANADKVAWYGDMTFMPHFLGLIRTRGIKAKVEVLGEVPFRGHRCRKRLTSTAKGLISAAYFTA